MHELSRTLCKLALATVIGLCAAAIPDGAMARKGAVSGDWAGVSSDFLDWPQDQFGARVLVGPFYRELYLVPGAAVSHGGERDLTMARGLLDIYYMFPMGDRLIPFVEVGVTGTAMRVDVLDHTGDSTPPPADRKTYLRGGFQVGLGVDLALGGSWSVSAAVKRIWLGDVDTDLVRRGGGVTYTGRDPSFWELPRLALVYWF